jgi:hypothetical protein
MWEIAFALSITGLVAFLLPVFFVYGRDSESVKDPAVEEIEQRQSDRDQ